MAHKAFFSMGTFILMLAGMLFIASYSVISAGTAFGIIHAGMEKEIVVIICIAMPLLLLGSRVFVYRIHNSVVSAIDTMARLWLVVLVYLFLGTIVLSIIFFGGGIFGIQAHMLLYSWIMVAMIALLFAYGITNIFHPRLTTYSISADALGDAWRNKKIVLVSDTHIGIVHGKKFLAKVVAKINAQNPDIVFIAGDVIDGPVFDYDRGLAPLKDLKAPLGIFYTPGNHERYNSEQEKFFSVMRGLAVTLIDDMREVNGTQIIGIDYKQESAAATKERFMKTGYDKNKPSIVMLHDPKNTPALVEEGASLILSGHTHRGQFFPVTVFIKMMYKNLGYGINTFNRTVSIVSSGAGTSVSAFRLGANPEIVTIKIK